MLHPDEAGGNTVSVYVVIDDVDAHAAKARAAGAKIIMEPADQDYGGRLYAALDGGTRAPSHFQPISGARNQRIQRRHEKHTDQQSREQAADDDQGKRPLRIRTDTGGERHR